MTFKNVIRACEVHILFSSSEAMMLVKCTQVADGPGPSEATVSVLTVEGHREEVVLAKRLLRGDKMNVGSALLQEGGNYFIELPRESASGRWRIWVPESEIVDKRALEAAE